MRIDIQPAFLVALIAFAISTACSAAGVPREIADCKVHRVWHFDKSAEGWHPDHNVGEFSVKDGVLSFENTGPDPWIINRSDLDEMDTSAYGFLGIKMRSSASGSNQIYFGTSVSPDTAQDKELDYSIAGDDEFRFYEIDLSVLKTWTGKLTTLRIDPANGRGEVGAKIGIDWIALYQVPARLTMGRPYAGNDDEGVFVSLPIENIGGERSGQDVLVYSEDTQIKVPAIDPHETGHVTIHLLPRSADIPIAVVADGRLMFDALIASPYEKDCRAAQIQNEQTTLLIPDMSIISRVVLLAREGDTTAWMGVFRPLATLAYKDSQGLPHYMEVSAEALELVDEHTAVLKASRLVDGGTADFEVRFELPRGSLEGRMSCKLTSDTAINVLRFEGPRLLAGEGSFGSSKTHGLFPGLEYLDKDEPSSAVKHVGPIHSERRVPHPYKVAVPLMAVESEHGVTGIAWDPLAEWADGCALPCGQFESPNWSHAADNHLMTLFAPFIPDYVDENTDFAANAYTLNPGESLRISGWFFARADEAIEQVVPNYYKQHGTPKPPLILRGIDGTIDTCFAAYTDSLYFPDKKGWKNHVGLKQTPSFSASFAALVLAESMRKSDISIAQKCDIKPDAQLSDYTGTTLDWFSEDALRSGRSVVERQSPDGGFGYQISDALRQKTREWAQRAGCDADTLGDIGQTNSGLIARDLINILSYALRTGKQEFIDSGLNGLARLNSFTVPRGAQIWEVHMHVPDIYAAGLAVDANMMGYQLTGQQKYLDYAKFWAYTGVPFVYAWVPPIDPVPDTVFHSDEQGEGTNPVYAAPSEFYHPLERHVNPGATIPVFGTSFYLAPWFGIPVQWCGLGWANSAAAYLDIRSDPFLQSITDMVFASATQQQVDKGFLAGTYPDSWNLMTNTSNAAFIAPDLILRYAYHLKSEKRPSDIRSVGFDLAGERLCLNTYALIESCECSGGRMEAGLKYYSGQYLHTCISRSPKPQRVLVDGSSLPPVPDLDSAERGWFYDQPNSALHIKYSSDNRKSKLAVMWNQTKLD